MTVNSNTGEDNGAHTRRSKAVTPVWETASRWPLANEQTEPWWRLVGPHLAKLTEAAGYKAEKQFEVLLFLLSQVLPRVGNAPSPDSLAHWKSCLTNDGSPFEYSWKWNQKFNTPEIRYCIEAIGTQAGRPEDPVNYLETDKLLVQLAPLLPRLDLTWLHHFAKAFRTPDVTGGKHAEDPVSSMFVAFEHLKDDVVVKAYFLPPGDSTRGPPSFSTFNKAIRSLALDNRALDAVLEYVSSDKYGLTLAPDMLAIDCIEPSKSRLKLYVGSPHTSLESIISVITLGGKIKNVENGIQQLTELFHLVLGVDAQTSPLTANTPIQDPFDAALAHPFDLYENMVYYFDIAPGSALPDVKFYIPVIRYGKSDGEVAGALGQFLRLHKRGQFVDGFLSTLDEIRERHAPGSGHRIQTFIAVAFQKDGELALTSYMNPGFYHQHFKGRNRTAVS